MTSEVHLRLWLVGIARGTQGGGELSLLIPAPPGHGSMSPFRTQSHHPEKAPSMRHHVGWSPNRRKAKECDLGPLLTQGPELEHILGEPAGMQGVEGGVQFVSRALCGELQSLVGVDRLPG